MTRWSLSNYFRKTTLNQFTALVDEFKNACEAAFDTSCEVEARLLSRPKTYSTFMLDDDAQDFINEENRRAEIIRTRNFTSITKEQWNATRYAEVNVSPVVRSLAPDFAFGHAEFKGMLPRTATFYIQGGEKIDSNVQAMVEAHPRMVKGDGNQSNGRQSIHGFMSVASTLHMPRTVISGIASKLSR